MKVCEIVFPGKWSLSQCVVWASDRRRALRVVNWMAKVNGDGSVVWGLEVGG